MASKSTKQSNDDPVLDWLESTGRLTGYTAPSGRVDIICPWVDQHTEAAERPTRYLPLAPALWPTSRAFHCFHRWCRTRTTEQFLQYVADSGGPDVKQKDRSSASRKILAAMRKSDPRGFMRNIRVTEGDDRG